MTGDIAGGGSGQQHNAAARRPMDVERRVRDPGRGHSLGRYHPTSRDRSRAGHGASPSTPDFSLLLQKPDLVLVAIAGFGVMWGTWGFASWQNALVSCIDLAGRHLV
jgi:hypothetical protein